MVYSIIMLTALVMFTSLAVDYARVQLAKTELRRAADAAARAGASGLSSGVTTAQNLAVTYGGYNAADGTAVVIDPNNDVEFGTWDATSRTFTVLTGASRANANAIRVTARRTANSGTGISLAFARVLGMNTCDVTASAIAMITPQAIGVTGLDSVAIHQSFFGASYNSSVQLNPSHSVYNAHGMLASNGVIGVGAAGTSNLLYGDALLGPSGSVNASMTVYGGTTQQSTAIPAIPDVSYAPFSNPSGIPSDVFVGGSVIAPAGKYYLTSLTCMNSTNITFTGPATIYVDGNVSIGDDVSIHAYGDRAQNLMIYQSPGHNFTCHDRCDFVFQYQGPGADFVSHDDLNFCGSVFAKTLTFHDRCSAYYDESLGAGHGVGAITLVK